MPWFMLVLAVNVESQTNLELHLANAPLCSSRFWEIKREQISEKHNGKWKLIKIVHHPPMVQAEKIISFL
jgi:hypothetical protein